MTLTYKTSVSKTYSLKFAEILVLKDGNNIQNNCDNNLSMVKHIIFREQILYSKRNMII